MRRRRSAAAVVAAVVAASGLAACGDDDTAATTTTTLGVASPTSVEELAVTVTDPPPTGRARVVVGATVDATLEIERCSLTTGAPGGAATAVLVELRATGTGAAGEAVVLEVLRSRTQAQATTLTDTVTVVVTDGSGERALQAQRFEVAGQLTDPRDPDATQPLVTVDGPTVRARGRFGPGGGTAEEGLLADGAVWAVCP